MIRSVTLATVALAAICGCQGPSESELLDDAYVYTGSIRVSMAHPTDAAKNVYQLLIAAASPAASMTICETTGAITTAAQCARPAQGSYTTSLIYEAGGRVFFEADNTAVITSGLNLMLVARDTTGAVIDSRIVQFNPAGSTSVATNTTTSTGATGGGTPPPSGTGGSGGKTGFYEGTFGQGGRYQIVAPADISATKSYGLLIFLHGSTASNYDTFAKQSDAVAKQNGLISVSVLAPNGAGWNETDGNAAAKYLDDFVQGTLYKQYNIDTNKVFFHGQSSGSGFLSSYFVALYGNKYKGGALMLCGAQRPESTPKVTDDMKKSFRLYYDLTVDDGIWTDQLKPASDAYKAAGLAVTIRNDRPGGHCQFDQQQIVGEVIPEMLKADGL